MSHKTEFDYSEPLIAFAEDMRAALQRNSGKGNWRRDSMHTFHRRCAEELQEVRDEIEALNNLPAGWRDFFEWYDERPRQVTVRRNPGTGEIEMAANNGGRLDGSPIPAKGEIRDAWALYEHRIKKALLGGNQYE